MPGFEDDFAKGEAAAARLAARMAEATKRFEQVAEVEARDAKVREKTAAAARREAQTGRTTTPESAPKALKDNISFQERAKQATEERIRLEARYRGELEQTGAASRRVGSGLIPSPLASAGGAGGSGRLPPRFFAQPPPGEPPYGGRGLPPGSIPPQLPLGGGGGPRQLLARNPEHPDERIVRNYRERASALKESTAAEGEYATRARAMRAAEGDLGPAIGRTAQFQRAANMEYQRFGALSSEWIGATARGATTIHELGRQTTATIGKFGGWLAAGSLIFTALAGVRAIGHGAIESASGVNQLERVIKKTSSIDPNSVQKSFRESSQHFNLPISDVTNAAYEMAKVFKTQDEALEASKAVLYAVKIGELDTATASRYLIATINGFHLPAGKLVGVFDQLNNAQNEFGISINDAFAGIAKASGSFNAATTKGSPLQKYHELLALITTAQKATGQTGQVVGTAIQRAPNFLRQAKNKNILKQYGINAGGDLNDIIVQAFEKAQGLSGHKIADLASAIFGPQYGARIGTPLLQQFDLYKKVLSKTTSKASKGSGETELQTQLGSLSEQISRIGTDLEQLGSNLAEAGFFDLLGAGVKSLDEMLQFANHILEVFNNLPDPLKHSLAILVEMKLALGALRKFSLGDNFQNSTARRVFNGPNAGARKYNDLLFEEEREVRRNLESNNRSQITTERRLPPAASRVGQEEAVLRSLQTQGVDQKVLLSQERNIVAAKQHEQGLITKQIESSQLRRDLLVELDAIERDNVALSASRNDATAAQLATARNRTVPGSNAKGGMTARELAREGGEEFRNNETVVPVTTAAKAEQDAAARATRDSKASASAFKGVGGKWRTFAQTEGGIVHPIESFRAARGNAVNAMEATAGGISRARSTLPTLGTALGKVGSGLKGLGAGLYGLVGGPLGALIIGAYAAFEYGDDLGRALAGGQEEIDAASEIEHGGVKSTKRKKDLVKQYEDFFREQGTTLKEYHKAEAEGAASVHLDNAPKYFDAGEAAQQGKLIEAQAKALQEGRVAAGLGGDVLKHQAQALEGLKPGTVHFTKAINTLKQNIALGDASKGEQKKLKTIIETAEAKQINASSDIASFFKSYNALADKLLQEYVGNLSTLVQAGPAFAAPKDVHRYINASVVQGVRDLASPKPKVQAEGVQALQEISQTLAAYEQQELKDNLTLAKTQSQRERAYNKYTGSLQRNIHDVRASFTGKGKELTAKLRKTNEQIKKLESEGAGVEYTPQQEHNHPQKHPGPGEAFRTKEGVLERLKERRAGLSKTEKILDKQLAHQERELRVLLQEHKEEQIAERVSVLGELGQIATARIGSDNPVAQARATLNYAQKALQYVRASGGNPQDRRQAFLQVLNARQSLEDAERQEASDLASAAEALAQAEANGDPILEAQAEIRKAQADMANARTAADRKSALAELLNAEHKLQEDRVAIAFAQLGLAAAQTEDPVKKAAIKVREAEVKLRNAHGKAATLEARASRAEAVREEREAVNNARIEDVEFQADIGRITVDQEIAAYTRLLRTLKLGKQARRSLIEKIHSLQEEASGNLELTVGNIQLPTLYDIRRAVQGGVNGGHSYTDASSHETIININGGDLNAVGRVVDNALKRNSRNSRRSAGLIK